MAHDMVDAMADGPSYGLNAMHRLDRAKGDNYRKGKCHHNFSVWHKHPLQKVNVRLPTGTLIFMSKPGPTIHLYPTPS